MNTSHKGEKLRRIRAALGWHRFQQRELARAAGVSEAYVSLLFAGKRRVTGVALNKLQDGLRTLLEERGQQGRAVFSSEEGDHV